MIIKGVECARRIFDEVALELSKLKSSEFFSSWGLNGFCSVPEHKRVIALCSSKVVTKLLSTHRRGEIQEEVIIKGGHVNIRSQVKISNPNFTIKTVTMTKIGNGWNHVFFRYKNYLKKYVVKVYKEGTFKNLTKSFNLGGSEKEHLSAEGTQPLMECFTIKIPLPSLLYWNISPEVFYTHCWKCILVVSQVIMI